MLDLIYKALAAKLASVDVSLVDWYDEQYIQQGDQEFAVSSALLIEFTPLSYSTLRAGVQDVSQFGFSIHVVQESLHRGAGRVADTALAHFEKVRQVYELLHEQALKIGDIPGMESDAQAATELLGSIVRTGLRPDHQLSNLVATVVNFQARHIDHSLQQRRAAGTTAVNASLVQSYQL